MDKKVYEKCGIVGYIDSNYSKKFSVSILAAAGLQHRGQHGAGVAMQTKDKIVKHTGTGLVSEVFGKKQFEKLNIDSLWTMVHLRYGTFGGYDSCNIQPCIVGDKLEEKIAVIHNGEFVRVDKFRDMIRNIDIPKDASDTYLFTAFLQQIDGRSWDQKIVKATDMAAGAYSMIIGVKGALYVIRDKFGIRPLVYGQYDGGHIFASETHALDKVLCKVKREVRPGEIIKIDSAGLKHIRMGEDKPGNYCDFEWAYFSRPDSLSATHEEKKDRQDPSVWLSYSKFREKCGQVLAKEAPVKNASFVVGVPDSGLAVSIGYAQALSLPYSQTILRDHFDPNGMQRLFMRDDQIHLIAKKVLGKLSLVPDPKIWKDAIVVVGDDSIVRGNVSREITRAMFALGARQVHWIIGYPPVAYTCHLGVSMRTEQELIAHRHNADPKSIAREMGATSVNYISHKGFISARKKFSRVLQPKNIQEIFLANGGCGGCITGVYPVDKEGKQYTIDN